MRTWSALLLAIGFLGCGLWVLSSAIRVEENHLEPPSPESVPSEVAVARGFATAELGAEELELPMASSRESAVTDARARTSIRISELLALPEKTVAEVWAKTDAIEAELYTRADPILREAFANGYAKPVSGPINGMCSLGQDAWNDRNGSTDALIAATRQEGKDAPCRVVLARSDFPDLYVLKDASDRLRRRAQTLPGTR